MFAEDLSAFFSADEHAITAQLNGAGVVGILTGADHDPTLRGTPPAGSTPTFVLPTASVPIPWANLPFVIPPGQFGAGHYTVGTADHDGTGVTTLHLNFQHL